MKYDRKTKRYCKLTERETTIIEDYVKAVSLGNKLDQWVGPNEPRCIYERECCEKEIACLYSGYGGDKKQNPFD